MRYGPDSMQMAAICHFRVGLIIEQMLLNAYLRVIGSVNILILFCGPLNKSIAN